MARANITDREFENLCEQLTANKKDADRLRLLKSVLRTEDFMFSAAQVGIIVDIIAYGDPKVKAAIALHERCYDVANFRSVLDHFKFAEDKNEIIAALHL